HLCVGPCSVVLNASVMSDVHRLPELFCGFHRRTGEGPTSYPVACSPQAWAAGVVFQFLQSCLHFSIDAEGKRLCVNRATLPSFLNYVRVRTLDLPFGNVDLLFERHPRDTGVTVLRKTG